MFGTSVACTLAFTAYETVTDGVLCCITIVSLLSCPQTITTVYSRGCQGMAERASWWSRRSKLLRPSGLLACVSGSIPSLVKCHYSLTLHCAPPSVTPLSHLTPSPGEACDGCAGACQRAHWQDCQQLPPGLHLGLVGTATVRSAAEHDPPGGGFRLSPCRCQTPSVHSVCVSLRTSLCASLVLYSLFVSPSSMARSLPFVSLRRPVFEYPPFSKMSDASAVSVFAIYQAATDRFRTRSHCIPAESPIHQHRRRG